MISWGAPPKSARWSAAFLVLAALALATVAVPWVARAEVADPYSRFYELYVRTVRISSRGVDVCEVLEHLSEVLKLLELGRYGEALEEMGRAEEVLARLEHVAGALVLRVSLAKYGGAAVLASVPLAVYVLLPRVYVYAWYRARRRWVVVSERTRR